MSDVNMNSSEQSSHSKAFEKPQRKLLRRSSKTAANLEPQVTPVEDPNSLTEAELALSATALKREIAKKRRELKAAKAEIAQASESKVTLEKELADSKSAIESIQNWRVEISRSYVWKVQQSMDSQLDSAKADLVVHEASVNGLQPLDEGRLLALRKKFHRTFGRSFWWALVGAALTTLIANLDRVPRQDWLSPLYNPQTSGPILVATIILLGGLATLVRRFIGKEILTRRRIVKFCIWLVVLAIFVFLLPLIWNDLNEKIVPWFKTHYWEILSGIGTSWLLVVLGALVAYYSGWTVFRRDVQKQLHDLKAVIDGYVKTQQEVGRLTILYKQTTDWLEILANALYRPWKTNPDWGTSREFSKHFETFPHSLRVAVASEKSGAEMASLENAIASRLLVQGWRNRAFEDLVTEVGAAMGMANGTFTVDNLDHDLPHQTNNSRALLKKYLKHSAQAYSPSTVTKASPDSLQDNSLAPTDDYLVSVARARLLALIDTTQSQLLSQTRPRVQQIIDDPLADLRGDTSGVSEQDSTQNWDQFLTQSLGGESIEQVPLGALSFTTAGRTSRAGQDPKSHILIPNRLGEALPHIASPEKVEVNLVGDDKPRAVEIMARIDVAGPVDFLDLALLNGGHSGRQAPPSNQQVQDEPEAIVYGREDL